jgi:hyperosmotically inducible periplasmic protein
MQKLRSSLMVAVAGMVLSVAGCSTSPPKAADVTTPVKDALKQAGLNDVSVDQDRDKGVVTLGGHVPADSDKARAEGIAKATAAGQVVANQIAVLPPGGESTAKDVNSDLDKGIEKNLDAALLQNGMHDNVKHDTKNGVVTLKGSVNSQEQRSAAQKVAATVPNVQQVINKLDVKEQPATATR